MRIRCINMMTNNPPKNKNHIPEKERRRMDATATDAQFEQTRTLKPQSAPKNATEAKP